MSESSTPQTVSIDVQWLLARLEAQLPKLERINPHAKAAFAELTEAVRQHRALVQGLHAVKDDLQTWLHAGRHLPQNVFTGMEQQWDLLHALLQHVKMRSAVTDATHSSRRTL